MTCRKAFDLERQSSFEGIRDYVVCLVGVHFVRNVREGMRGGACKNSEADWHDPKGL